MFLQQTPTKKTKLGLLDKFVFYVLGGVNET